jgi:hypothetical protein
MLFKLLIIIVVMILGCAVFSAFSSFLYGHVVAGIFRLAECDAGFIVSAPHGWFCVGTLPVDICAVSVDGSMVVMSVEYVEMSVYSHVCPVAAAGGEPLCKVWFPLLWDISDWDGVCERCVAWREYMAGLDVGLMRRCVRVRELIVLYLCTLKYLVYIYTGTVFSVSSCNNCILT